MTKKNQNILIYYKDFAYLHEGGKSLFCHTLNFNQVLQLQNNSYIE